MRFPLRHLRSLTPEAAAGLAQWPENVALSVGVPSPEAAAALAPHEHDLRLDNLRTLDGADAIDVARALARKRGSLRIPHLERITIGALKALATKTDIDLPPIEEFEVVPDDPGGASDDVVLPRALLGRQRERGP